MTDSVALDYAKALLNYLVPNFQSRNQNTGQIDSPIPDIDLVAGRLPYPLPSSSCSAFENLLRKRLGLSKFSASNISSFDLFVDAGLLLAENHDDNQRISAKILTVLLSESFSPFEFSMATLNEQHVPDELSPSRAQSSDYENALEFLLCSPLGVDSWHITEDSASWYGEFQPMLMHSDADGTELTEPLPDEPAPMSRKRKIRRAVEGTFIDQ